MDRGRCNNAARHNALCHPLPLPAYSVKGFTVGNSGSRDTGNKKTEKMKPPRKKTLRQSG